MPVPVNPLSGSSATRQPTIRIGFGMGELVPLSPLAAQNVDRVVVENDLHRPNMFEITFRDPDGLLIEEAGLVHGATVEILGPSGDFGERILINGEITALEMSCDHLVSRIVARGYDRSHRLRRAQRTRTFREVTDADIARLIVEEDLQENPLQLPLVQDLPLPIVHQHIAQFNQTDWDFLQWRAREIGCETGFTREGVFYFRPSSSSELGAAEEEAEVGLANQLTGSGVLTLKQNLISFTSSINAAGLTPEVEVRTWDPSLAEAMVGTMPTESETVNHEVPIKAAELATESAGVNVDLPTSVSAPPLTPLALGPPASANARVIFDRPVGAGAEAAETAEVMAAGLSDDLGSTYAEAEGYADGDAAIQAGGPVVIEGVSPMFAGEYSVSRARHIFDDEEGGYYTRFWVTGRQDRSLLGLIGGRSRYQPPRINGFVCGIVTNNGDFPANPEGEEVPVDPDVLPKGRVKLTFPWLSPLYESDWARVVQIGSGPKSGGLFVPEVGDEVLVGFEHGDLRRPFVVGGLINVYTSYLLEGLGPPVVDTLGNVVRRGFASPSGNQLSFTDVVPPAEGAPVEASAIMLGGWRQNIGLRIDQVAGSVLLNCVPIPDAVRGLEPANETGVITILCPAGTVNVTAGGVMVEAAEELTLSSPVINIEAEAELNISSTVAITANAPLITLNAE